MNLYILRMRSRDAIAWLKWNCLVWIENDRVPSYISHVHSTRTNVNWAQSGKMWNYWARKSSKKSNPFPLGFLPDIASAPWTDNIRGKRQEIKSMIEPSMPCKDATTQHTAGEKQETLPCWCLMIIHGFSAHFFLNNKSLRIFFTAWPVSLTWPQSIICYIQTAYHKLLFVFASIFYLAVSNCAVVATRAVHKAL